MKTPHCSVIVAVFAGCLLFSPVTSLAADQPNMRAAIDLLQEAKKSDQPIPLMQQAKTHLKNASRNKGGSRVDAIEELNKAIEFAKAGDLEKARGKMNRVISEIHSGMDKAK